MLEIDVMNKGTFAIIVKGCLLLSSMYVVVLIFRSAITAWWTRLSQQVWPSNDWSPAKATAGHSCNFLFYPEGWWELKQLECYCMIGKQIRCIALCWVEWILPSSHSFSGCWELVRLDIRGKKKVILFRFKKYSQITFRTNCDAALSLFLFESATGLAA